MPRLSSLAIFLSACLLPSASLQAAEPSPEPDRNRAEADRRYQENLATFTNNPDALVLPGLIARRDVQEVRVLAESTASTVGDPLEFVLTSTTGGHDYEALATALAKPSAVDAALRFIGLTPGHAPDPAKLAFWPKGERVAISVTVLSPATNAWTGELPVESLLWDVTLTQALPQAGFIFVDAPRVPDTKHPGKQLFLPDESSPGSIVALYNEPATMFDVPRLAAQGSVYGSRRANPNHHLPAHTLLEYIFRPAPAAAGLRVLELVLTVQADSRFTLTGATPEPVPAGLSTDALVRVVADWVQSGRDPFVRVRLDAALPLSDVHTICRFLNTHEGEFGLRIEPPDPDQLYYRAFIPDEGNRQRKDRVGQPWELHLRRGESNTLATVTHLTERWHDDLPDPEILATDRALAAPADLRAALDTMGPGMPVILIFADPTLTHGELMRWVQVARPTHGIIHVYLDFSQGAPLR